MVKNLARTKSRQDLLAILEEGFLAISPLSSFRQKIKLKDTKLIIRDVKKNSFSFSLGDYKNIYVIGAGKASGEAACELEKILGDFIKEGIVIDIKAKALKKIKVKKGTHPVISEKNIKITRKILKIAQIAKKDDLVIFLISGGGSTLLEKPAISLKKLTEINKKLLKSGASIEEINIIRKHLSKIKGGKLVQIVNPATLISLIFSDVPSDKLEIIASGPTVSDSSTLREAERLAQKYKLGKVKFTETPKEKKIFKKTYNILILNNLSALESMEEKAKTLGYRAEIYSHSLAGKIPEVGKKLVEFASKQKKNTLILAGGEVPSVVKGKGKGGRCTEMALSSLKCLKEDLTFCACASDGQDNTEAAGAIVDKLTLNKAQKLNLNINKYLANSDSFNFFKKTGDLIFTGPSGSNVADLFLVIKN